jgi:hypothetical protein
MFDSNNHIIQAYIDATNISIPSLISFAIIKQPEIIVKMTKINDIEFSVLQTKVKQFMNNNPFFDNPQNVIMTIFICNIMYKNDIVPKLIHDILSELNSNVTIEELKQNAESLINALTTSVKKGGQKGGNFSSIISHLTAIGYVIFVVSVDYWYINQNIEIFVKDYNKALSYYKSISNINPEKCNYIEIPEYISLLDDWNPKWENKISEIYKYTKCIANKDFNKYFYEHSISEKITNITAEINKVKNDTSTALVPVDSSTALVPFGLKSTEFNALISVRFNPTVIESEFKYKMTNDGMWFDKEDTIEQLDNYINMDLKDLHNILFPKSNKINDETINNKINDETINNEIVDSFWGNTWENTINTGMRMINMVKKTVSPLELIYQETEIIRRIFKDIKRQVEDAHIKIQRDVEDTISDVNSIINRISGLIRTFIIIAGMNYRGFSVIGYYFNKMFKKLKFKSEKTDNFELAIKNGPLAVVRFLKDKTNDNIPTINDSTDENDSNNANNGNNANNSNNTNNAYVVPEDIAFYGGKLRKWKKTRKNKKRRTRKYLYRKRRQTRNRRLTRRR